MEFENKKLRDVADVAARIMMGEKALHPNQQKLDVHEPEKDELTAHDFKKLRSMKKEETMHEESCDCGACPSDKDMKKEEVDLDEGKMGQLSADLKDLSHDDFHKEYGKPKSHYDPSNFKKPVQPGKEMDRARSLAQRAMASMKKEEVDTLSEVLHPSAPGTAKWQGKTYARATIHKHPGAAGGLMVHTDKTDPTVHHISVLDRGHSPMHIYTVRDNAAGNAADAEGSPRMDAYYGKYAQAHKDQMQGHKSVTKEEVESLEEYKSTAGVYKHQGTYGTEKSIESGFTDYDKENELAKKHLSPKKPVKKGARQNRNFNTKLYKEGFSALLSSYSENGMKGLFESLKKEDIIAEEPTNDEFNAQLDDAKKRAAGTKKQPEVAKAAVQAVQNEEIELTLEDFTPEELEEFMQTEEYEQLDELSKSTLGSYVKKAASDVNTKSRVAQQHKDMFAGNYPVRGAKKEVAKKQTAIDKRVGGIGKAVDRLTKEEIEEQTHTTVSFIDYNDVNGVKYAEIDLAERKLTDAETEKKEDTVKSMKKNLAGFKDRYGDRAKEVMYATATANAKKSS